MAVVTLILIITLTAEILTTLAVGVSILVPKHRIWPPNEKMAWGKPLMLVLFNLTAVGDQFCCLFHSNKQP